MEILQLSVLLFSVGIVSAQTDTSVVKWCVVNEMEHRKCTDLTTAIAQHVLQGRSTTVEQYTYFYKDLPIIVCVQGSDQYDCMKKIFNDEADIMQLETGLSYTAGQYYNMKPLVAEKYQPGLNDDGLKFFAVAVARKDNPSVSFKNLKGKRACLPGVGQAAGWIYPVSTLIQAGKMDIAECNVPVKSADAFFGEMCAPDALARYYNPFGNNPTTVCKGCGGHPDTFCTCNDPYAGYDGAFNCMATGQGDVTFVRHTTVDEFIANTNTTFQSTDFELVCTDDTRAPITSAASCNWGTVSSHIVMTSLVRSPDVVAAYKTLLLMLSIDFGQNGASNDLFNLFSSIQYGRQNLMFTDETVMLKDTSKINGGSNDSYYAWAGPELRGRLVVLNSCPIKQASWCVISQYEMIKCENMIMAFSAKNIKPDLNCVQGASVQDCMQKISIGDADLITLDAADVYQAGMEYDLRPIAREDYSGGDEEGVYYSVAVARRANVYLTLFNMKQRRTCHSGVMTAAGWVIPVDKLIETGQIVVKDCDAYLAVGQYFSKSCVPGILSSYYNPYKTNPVNLCEACQTSGPKRCLRNDDELYFGSSGAFRCVTEKGGDVGFVRHTTIRENTDGRNQADWARNRRSDDYELLCNDGTRKDIDDWRDCNLASIPNNAIVTAGFKSDRERSIFWTLLNFAQQFFDADQNPDFAMFDSYINHRDLIFQDATVRLLPISSVNQTYIKYLGPDFVRRMQSMKTIDCVTGGASVLHLSMSSVLTVLVAFYQIAS